MTTPTISCILPVYNGARFIAEALDSVLAQTLGVTEIIVVDDGSTDALDTALAPYLQHIDLLRQSNAGPGAARNRGTAAARGEYLCFIDADDRWLPEKLERQYGRFCAQPDLELSLCLQKPFWMPEVRSEEQRLKAQDHPFSRVHEGNVCQAMLMPRATFERVGEFNAALVIGEDSDWLLRAEELGVRREMLDEVLLERRLHDQNLSNRNSRATVDGRLDFIAEQLRRRRSG